MNLKANKSILTGIMITAGSTIGAGMFSLPVAASGKWFWYSIVCLFFLWLLNYWAALYILEATFCYMLTIVHLAISPFKH